MSRPANASTESAAGRLIMTGQALPKRAAGENNTGVRSRSEVKATVSGGKLESAGGHLDVSGADSVTLTIVAGTEIREKDLAAACARDLAAASRAYDELRSDHIADHRHFFRRVRLELPVDAAVRALPTDERLARVEKGEGDLGLVALDLQFGRYLLMSCSRPGGLRRTCRASGTTAAPRGTANTRSTSTRR